MAAHRRHRHAFDAAGDANIDLTDGDRFGDVGDGVQTRRAETVDGGGGGFDGQAGHDAGDPRDVHALFGLGHRAAEDHVFDALGLDAGALDGDLDDVGGEGVGANVLQRASACFGNRGADGGDDGDFTHGTLRFLLNESNAESGGE